MTDTKIIPINITETAKTEVIRALGIKGIPENYFLRVGLRGGACSATYLIGFDKMTEHDELYEINDLKVLIDKRHLMYLINIELDFEEEGNGFTFNKL
ncbi:MULTISPECIES: iron-sulfur cluster assembly accessory protein [Arcicella]|uniref:Iron-sulfur cluster assembly accessory protein n=1 Tax=Arcicella aquatica TaxID=217141 RepID=A0ABU5QJ76_9BACT|nr:MULTISPECIES: iron-sulfur cluster assembly accessory protein [Arcicella]MDR6562930.1 iron-sulfur cluster assembly protein [Arcicella sp. BE51]MDR6813013.1 iron-sulfur cluster assembly protein [Arcicella sp. BE140]MDR6824327.1 iron-sulfur cluster assembly protein [Arcicella sp. BE139]MEA5256825.1 iron-sulfur cluster assembly accessory protein [Arcicella aquatica]